MKIEVKVLKLIFMVLTTFIYEFIYEYVIHIHLFIPSRPNIIIMIKDILNFLSKIHLS